MPEPSDERLAAILASVADHLVVSPPTAVAATADPSSNGSSPHPIPPPAPSDDDEHAARWRPRLLAAAAVVIVATVVGAAIAPVREAVAGWLGIGSTEIVRVGVGEGDPSGLPYLSDDLDPVDRSTAERQLGTSLPDTGDTELGPAPVLAVPPEGGVIMAWDDGATTLWVQRDPRPAGEIMSKLLTFDDRLEPVDGLGEDAAIVEGAHVLSTPQRRLAAGTVLVWVDGGFAYRLESDLDPERLVAIARSVRRGESP